MAFPGDSSARASVLVVEDASATRRGLSELLRMRGYEVYEAQNGAEGIQLLREHGGASVVVLDLKMPGTDGYWFREQQLQDPALADIPVIVFSGSVPGDRLHSLNVRDVLLKPFSVDELLDAVDAANRDGAT
jgi:CheY-like chemotaxis protein